MSLEIITFGCRVNTYESEVMREQATAAGLTDAVIVNSCSVTGEAERQARQTIRRLRRERPTAKIIVTGCAAQISPDTFAAMPEVDHVVGNDLKLQAETYRCLTGQRVLLSDIQKVREAAGYLVHGFEGKSRAFVQVQNGCDHRCTFCIVPLGRGPSRSVPAADVIAQVAELVAGGYHEIALTGVDITAYGADLPQGGSLGILVRDLLRAVPDLRRLRLSSLDPVEVDDALFDVLANEPRLMPHLHLSLQAGDDLILKRMKRRHRVADLDAFCARARALRPEIVFGADVIAGFPTEDETMFETGVATLQRLGITWLHVFPYSVRAGTPAARMPVAPMEVRRARAARLRALGKAALTRYLDTLVGTTTDVLVEKPDLGRTPGFAEAILDRPASIGAVVRVAIVGHHEGKALAKVETEGE
jgi:threonylcarbamoyladenosine tRNA methylthiotransferase MtaB